MAAPNRRDGADVMRRLNQVSFAGVSGDVAFDNNGDRADPQYSIFNAQGGTLGANAGIDSIKWTDIGATGADVGSVELTEPVCFAEAGCSWTEFPNDTYPPLPNKLPWWVSVAIACMAVLLVALAFKYSRSRRRKKGYKAELEALQKSIVGMRAATCDYLPTVAAPPPKGDLEEGALPRTIRDVKGIVAVAPHNTIQWCWKETDQVMHKHCDADIFGDREDCWIKYDDDANKKLEKSYQGKKKDVDLMNGAYKVDIKNMKQVKVETAFVRDIRRFEDTVDDSVLLDLGDVQCDHLPGVRIDLSDVKCGDHLPAELIGEPQMILVKGDIIQISSQRPDGWAFGTKLHHADEDAARKLLTVASSKFLDVSVDEEMNVFTDTGWFMLDSTRMPDSDDLAALQKTVGSVDAGALDAPSNWDPVTDSTVAQKHELKKGHPEYDEVVNAFMSTIKKNKVKVVKVERIQNLSMYQSYVVKRSTICYRETGHDTSDAAAQKAAIARFERSWLWHGSNVDVVGKILNQGFNRSFCGKNATAYGKGVYFARDASYSSHPTYSVPDFKKNQYILACRVCVGEYCPGKYDALTPDVRDPKTHSLYDSTVGVLNNDTLQNPSIYVTYHDAQAYPEYLITFSQ